MRQDWVILQWNDVLDIKNGKHYKNVININGKYPIYGSAGIINYADEYLCMENSTIIGRKGTINKPLFVKEKFWNIDTAFGIEVKQTILNPKYLYYFALNFNFMKLNQATAIPSLTKRNLLKIAMPISPLLEQKAIVSKIEQLFSELDNGIENLKTAQQKLKIYRQAVLKKAFEGELTKEWREKQTDLPTADELLEDIKKERKEHYLKQLEEWKKNKKNSVRPKKAKSNINIFETKSHNPYIQDWLLSSISTFLSLDKKGMATGPFGTLLKKSEHKKFGMPVLGIENIDESKFIMPNKIFITPEKALELTSFEVELNDIIISRSGTVGEICAITYDIGKALISTNLIRVSLNSNLIDSRYFVYLFQGGFVREQVKELCKGSTRDFLNQTILNSIQFPLPSLEEQTQIVQEIESRLSVCDNIETTINDALQKSEALRQSILKKAFEGKLLTDKELEEIQNHPEYESAEKLLERIKKNRGAS